MFERVRRMRIDGYKRVAPTGTRKSAAAGSASGQGFRVDSGDDSARQAQVHAPAGATGIDSLLALQAAGDAMSGRKKALKRAHSLLDMLEEIKVDLLAGRMNAGKLERAAGLLAQAKGSPEPGLEEIVADIELRVRVELAKLGRFPAL